MLVEKSQVSLHQSVPSVIGTINSIALQETKCQLKLISRIVFVYNLIKLYIARMQRDSLDL